ncbi:28S ribosomal protein S9, mitochondrial-like [Haliotis rufescens]|uniref:28S ribosomal protein S9, mitochondrial-like n=1 Tax=Haliotis rufescens TaxID=6454 RepID=UPI00201EB1F6|nr:28S ribosomal protein S9, mitochondrial-like [Haliotis rufescens]
MAAHMGRLRHAVLTNQTLLNNWRVIVSDVLPRQFHYSCTLDADTPRPSKAFNKPAPTKAEKISKAMKAYIERAQAQDEMLKRETADYEIGKRHLANIMGLDPEHMTDRQVKESIQYLLPSGLYDLPSRPLMKPPQKVFPKRKDAQFGMDGRPFHSFFYTGKPQFYELLHKVTWKLEALKKEEDKLRDSGALFETEEKTEKLSLHENEWISYDTLKARVMEDISQQDYGQFLKLMTRFVEHPLAHKEARYIMKFRQRLNRQNFGDKIKPLKTAKDGRSFMTAEGYRKSAVADVTVRGHGSGRVAINGSDLEYFSLSMHREQIMFPIQFVNMLGEIDIESQVSGGGSSSQAGAIRLGLAQALTSFVSPDVVEKMRLAGLLTRDPRRKERKKPGQAKARKKFTWKKR